MVDYFCDVVDGKSFTELINAANGCFAVIVETDSELLAAVDPVRSIPLFYAIKSGEIILGDDLPRIQEELSAAAMDATAQEEFLRVGYTVGPSTLDSRIKQIEAGESIVYDKSSKRYATHCYFRNAHDNYSGKCSEALIDELDLITKHWASRLIKSAEGRTIVVPLSGGYDSRSIVCALHREGYRKVICYSYGVPASYEHRIARRVALQLGYPIQVIDYSAQFWRPLLESPHFVEFCEFVSQRCAVPCIQEFLANEMLARAGAIPSDSIIVPGYCGDLHGGSRIPSAFREHRPNAVLAEGIDRYILRTLFNFRTSPIAPETEKVILSRINAYTSRFKSDEIEGFCSVFEDWFTRHRVARFVVNTVRTYEYFGHEWRLPLWDRELIEWWYRIPVNHRVNSRLYHRFLFERLFNPAEVAFRKPRAGVDTAHLADRWLPAAVIPMMRSLYRRLLKRPLSAVRPQSVDIDGFEEVSSFLLEQMSSHVSAGDFTNVNGVFAHWCAIRELSLQDARSAGASDLKTNA